MKKLLLIAYCLLFITFSHSQNLVPNPGFEIISSCHFGSGGIFTGDAPPWDSPTSLGSDDIYNTCESVPYYSVPFNGFAYQHPHSGNGYAGGGMYSGIGVPGGREYAQVELDSALVANRRYCASFYVNLANGSRYAHNNYGMYFSSSHLYVPTSGPLNYTPQINDTNIVRDTAGWTLIYGQFIAQGGERYLIIGNFYTDAQTDSIHLDENGAYPECSFVDDVNVHCCSCDSLDHTGEKEIVKEDNYRLYPNPNSGTMTLEYKIEGNDMVELSIYDVTGRIVKEQILNAQSNKAIILANELNAGVYYYVIKEGSNKVKAEKLIIVK